MKIQNKLAILTMAVCTFFSLNTSAQWSVTGNTGTIPTTNFVGTTDNADLVIKTNGQERLRILTGAGTSPLNGGQVGIGRIPVGNTSAGGTYINYGPMLQVEGPSNNNVPAWNPADIIRISNPGVSYYMGLGNGFIRSNSLQLMSSSVNINTSNGPSNTNLTLGWTTLKGTNNSVEFTSEVASLGPNKGFRVTSSMGDNIDASPWYGIGQTNKTLNGETGQATQLAGYYGLSFRTRGTYGSAIPDMIIQNGQVGIGKLSIPSGYNFSTNSISLGDQTSVSGGHLEVNGNSSYGYNIESRSNNSSQPTKLFVGTNTNYNGTGVSKEVFHVSSLGQMHLGTKTPGTSSIHNDYLLSVYGKIVGTSAYIIDVNASDWADYVFEKNYSLKPIAEVESYIKENKHLPEVPTAKEVEENGINLGKMDAILLKKIEELTLYMIEMNKKIEVLEKENTELRSKK